MLGRGLILGFSGALYELSEIVGCPGVEGNFSRNFPVWVVPANADKESIAMRKGGACRKIDV
jgi:hypothetical protein